MITLSAPFAWSTDVADHPASADPASLTRRRVTQCALSRICGACAEPLGRPIAFVGTTEEVARNSFHAPPLHLTCAESLAGGVPSWTVVTTSAYDFHRPNHDEPDPLPTFLPHALLG